MAALTSARTQRRVRPTTRAGIACIGVLLVLLLSALPLSAQTLRGRVVDATSGAAVGQVRIVLSRADGTRVNEMTTDPTGLFIFTLPAPGEYRVAATHIAYQPATSAPLTLAASEETVVELKLSTAPILLDPLTVVARQADPRHDASYDGLYARYRHFPPTGGRRVFLPHDPEMESAIRVEDVLRWALPQRGCTILYWNGFVQQSEAVVGSMLEEMSVSMLEGVEYYRTLGDAPLAYRQIPDYLNEAMCTSFNVVALWARTNRYVQETEPHYVPPPPAWHPRVNVIGYQLRGAHAPGIGGGLEISSHQEVTQSAQIGAFVRGTLHTLSAGSTADLTRVLSDFGYVKPPGSRRLQLWIFGADVKAIALQRPRLRVTASVRGQVAQRRFSLLTRIDGDEERQIVSHGWGWGVTAGAEYRIGGTTTAVFGAGQDWLRFHGYDVIDRADNPTSANWSATAVRLGIVYHPGR